MKKTAAVIMAMALAAVSLTACGGGSTAETTAAAASEAEQTTGGTTAAEDTSAETEAPAAGQASGPITVVSREDGSGTRGAFIELFGIEEKNDAGEKVDMTTEDAEITNSTSVMMTTIAGNKEAIGYISLGSLNDTVKAVKIDGSEATVDNIKSGAYKIARPFNIVTTDSLSDAASDFIRFIMSEEGQKVVEDNGYISQGNEGAYEAAGVSGKVVVAGSSSVTPVMEKLKEAYVALNPDVTIEVQQSDSTTGVTSAIEGVCDIGMASRELKDSETEAGVKATVIAMDGIAVIVNNDSPVTDLTSDNVKAIFTGEVTDWEDVK
ncbi:MAG: substrate-binding domain-containing protein [Eubacteriales bacterium]|nr:substrate-binding domain-containing protein [Eubacteriales bacterium]